jgi:hypothetical protein
MLYLRSIAQFCLPWTSALVHKSAHLSLVTFTTDSFRIRDALIRMAMARDTAPGLALFFALLAFSSLHRSGLHQQAIQLKISALQCLSAPLAGRLSPAEAAQHVAASMLLSAFEVSRQQVYTPIKIFDRCTQMISYRPYSLQEARASGCGMSGEP